MASIQDYHLYCDETYPQGPVAFAFGALICTRRRAEIMHDKLMEIRALENYHGEFKWNGLRKHKLPVYKSLVECFFADPYIRFSAMRVTKGHSWSGWANSEEERFFKSYYIFLMINAGPFSRYHVFIDDRKLQKGYRWSTLEYLVNRSRRDNWDVTHRNIKRLLHIDSKAEDLVQLSDLLLGCVTSSARVEHKVSLRQFVESQLDCRTVSGKEKIRIEDWTPRVR